MKFIRIFYFFVTLVFVPVFLYSQNIITIGGIASSIDCIQKINIDKISLDDPDKLETIKVYRLCSDSLSTSFIIWIKEDVALHKHEHHTETIYVAEGKGTMTLGEMVFEIKPGDIITVPMNTPHSVRVTSKELMKVLSIQSPEFKGLDRVMIID